MRAMLDRVQIHFSQQPNCVLLVVLITKLHHRFLCFCRRTSWAALGRIMYEIRIVVADESLTLKMYYVPCYALSCN